LQFGVNANQGKLSYGLWGIKYTSGGVKSTGISANMGYTIRGFSFIYSYDFRVPEGRSAIPSSSEISLRYAWKTKNVQPKFSNAIN